MRVVDEIGRKSLRGGGLVVGVQGVKDSPRKRQGEGTCRLSK
jgi:hypothetical protein